MSLPVGTRLGPYEILAPLGAGGMGVVYKARDTRLDRLVAVKVLAAHLSESPQARQRFDREAKIVSQLSHPHICTLFDVGHENGTDFLVMELLEGHALSERLTRGPLAQSEVFRFGVEIADALDKAHGAGIVHRDLKPANVMLTKSGVKLLDFGLAKALEAAAPDEVSRAATMSVEPALTQEGAVLGTLQYMAPEQVEGHPADARSDIFALGAVLYEMAAGRRPFSGESRAAVASAILSAEPEPLSAVTPSMPPAFSRLVRTCLEKNPDRRWQSAHDVALQLQALTEGDAPSVAAKTRGPSAWLPWAVAAVALLVALGALMRPRPAPPAAGLATVRFKVPPPPGRTYLGTVEVVPHAVSPDGAKLVLAARDASGATRLWLRPLASAEARALEGTEGATTAFWSPDSRSIAFAAGGKLKRLDLESGRPALALCDVRRDIGIGGSWGSAGQILYAAIEGEAIFSVPSGGGTPVVVVKGDPGKGDAWVNWPSFLPDGKRFLYLARGAGDSGQILLFTPGEPARVVRTARSPVAYVAPGQIVFAQDGTLLGQGFDEARGVAVGEPHPIAEPVASFTSSGWASFSVSPQTLVYGSSHDSSRLVEFDRSGRAVRGLGETSDWQRINLSPDGHKLLFDRAQAGTGTLDLWIFDLDRVTETRVTSDPGTEISGAWSPDGRAVVFAAPRSGPPHLYRKDLASGVEEELTSPGPMQFPLAISPDGRTLLFEQRSSQGDMDILGLPLAGPRTPVAVAASSFAEEEARFSPDGRAIALVSAESGSDEVYVRPYPGPGASIRVSTAGAHSPAWSRDSRELFFITSDGDLVAVPVRTDPTLEPGRPTRLFGLKGRGWASFVPTADGQHFLAVVPEVVANEQPLNVVLNWASPAVTGLRSGR